MRLPSNRYTVAEMPLQSRTTLSVRLGIGWRAADDPQDLRCRRLLLQGFGRGTLHIRIRRRGLGTPEPQDGRTALLAEFRGRTVLVLALRTRHAGASQRPGRQKVGIVGRDYPAETRVVKNTVTRVT